MPKSKRARSKNQKVIHANYNRVKIINKKILALNIKSDFEELSIGEINKRDELRKEVKGLIKERRNMHNLGMRG